MMPCYIVQQANDALAPVKIGFSYDVQARLYDLQISTYHQLSLLRVIDGGQAVEKWLHAKYKHLHIRGEWFSFDPSMLDVETPDLVHADPPHAAAFDKLMNVFGGRGEILTITGAKYNSITQWRLSGVAHRYWFSLLDEADARGIPGVRSLLEATRSGSKAA